MVKDYINRILIKFITVFPKQFFHFIFRDIIIIMEDKLKILVQLCGYMTTIETEGFLNLLESPNANLLNLRNNEGWNCNFNIVFHLMCASYSKEQTILRFIELTIE